MLVFLWGAAKILVHFRMNKFIGLACLVFLGHSSFAQWSNRYPKVDGYGHHVYMEAFELPIINAGLHDPAPSPSGQEIAFSARGWLWVLDMKTLTATRITSSPDVDSRPNWSPDGSRLVYVRDNGSDTWIMEMTLNDRQERILINSPAIDLDPIYSADGTSVYYSSAEQGSFDLWKIDLASSTREPLTGQRSLERQPVPAGDSELLYLTKQGFSYDNIEKVNLKTSEITQVIGENFVSQAAFSLAPDHRTMVYSWPHEDFYELRLLDIETPVTSLLLTESAGMPLVPKFSANGNWVYYAEFDNNERSQIKRISTKGGNPELLHVKKWDWGIPTKNVKLITKVDGVVKPVRLSILDQTGHPVVPENTAVRSEGQHGRIFFYSPGELELEVPEGTLTIKAVHGFSTQETTVEIPVNSSTQTAEVNLTKLWDARANGWYAGDNHFHLNYGGRIQLEPKDILLDMKAEDLDIGYPLVANLHNRYLEKELFGWRSDQAPLVIFGQEVRSHFLGHLNVIGSDSLFYPWIWGPGYNVYGRDDRTNAEALQFTKAHGGVGGYVHPVGVREPFSPQGSARLPTELIADCVLGEADILELGCLWTDEIGTGEVWHEILNIGVPLAISAGSDVMNDYFRTMSIGATRVYVKPDGQLTEDSYLKALKEGRSFVSNGPQLEFTVEGKEPGQVVSTSSRKAKWALKVHSPVAYEKVELFVNGQIVWTRENNKGAGNHDYNGSINVPVGGWVTARVSGGESAWPMMDSYPFAESSPVWFGEVGSVDPEVASASAQKLLTALGISENKLVMGYGDTPIPVLKSHFAAAREKLEGLIIK
jgi:TolB protein